jgi:hypothetical protein
MQMLGRNSSTGDYRYGFNGAELDDEVRGEGNALEFGGISICDGRLGRFVSIDPRSRDFPFMSPYCFAANTPIQAIDEDGEGPTFKMFSVDQSTRLKAALQSRNYVEVHRIVYYGAKTGFVDDKGNGSYYMQKRWASQGIGVAWPVVLNLASVSLEPEMRDNLSVFTVAVEDANGNLGFETYTLNDSDFLSDEVKEDFIESEEKWKNLRSNHRF